MRMRRFVLAYYAVLFCGFGLAALSIPEQFAKLMGSNLVSSSEKWNLWRHIAACSWDWGSTCFIV